MDPISSYLVGLNEPLLTQLSLIFHNTIFLLLFLTPPTLFILKDKRKKVLFSLVFLLLLAFTLKEIFQMKRECKNAKVECPSDYGFPSGHACIVFFFAAASFSTWSFPFYLLFAIFVSLSRVYLGVHILPDIIFGGIVGIIGYYGGEKLFNIFKLSERKLIK